MKKFTIYQSKMSTQELIDQTIGYANQNIKSYSNETLMAIALLPCLPTTSKETQESMTEFALYTKTQMLNPVYCTELVGTLFACAYQGEIEISDLSKQEQYLLADAMIDTKKEEFGPLCKIVGNKELLEAVLSKTKDIEKSPYLLKQCGEVGKKQVQSTHQVAQFQKDWINHIQNTELVDLLKEAHYHEHLEEDLIKLGL